MSTRVREVSAQEAEDFGISTDRFCTEIERGYLDADGDVVQYTVTVDYTNREHCFTSRPTPEDLARRV